MLRIYTDGACSGNPGPGGYGLVILKNNNIINQILNDYFDYRNGGVNEE